MQTHPYYSEVPEAERRRLLLEVPLGHLLSLSSGDGRPRIGFFPFVEIDGGFEVHLPRRDPQVADLIADGRSTFEVGERLAIVPPGWLGRRDARDGDALYRALVFDTRAEVLDDASAVAAHLARLLQRHAPDGDHAPLTADSPFYERSYARLVAIRLIVTDARATFKCLQQVPDDDRVRVVTALRARGTELDRHSADIVERLAAARRGA